VRFSARHQRPHHLAQGGLLGGNEVEWKSIIGMGDLQTWHHADDRAIEFASNSGV